MALFDTDSQVIVCVDNSCYAEYALDCKLIWYVLWQFTHKGHENCHDKYQINCDDKYHHSWFDTYHDSFRVLYA